MVGTVLARTHTKKRKLVPLLIWVSRLVLIPPIFGDSCCHCASVSLTSNKYGGDLDLNQVSVDDFNQS